MNHYKALKVDGVKQNYHRHLMEQHLGRKLKTDEIVHHIDGNKQNNDLDNLEVVLRSEHSRTHGQKIRNTARITPEDVGAIRVLLKSGMPQRAIAKQYGVGKATITDINRGHTWSWLKTMF